MQVITFIRCCVCFFYKIITTLPSGYLPTLYNILSLFSGAKQIYLKYFLSQLTNQSETEVLSTKSNLLKGIRITCSNLYFIHEAPWSIGKSLINTQKFLASRKCLENIPEQTYCAFEHLLQKFKRYHKCAKTFRPLSLFVLETKLD
jgi:hypothetical protein